MGAPIKKCPGVKYDKSKGSLDSGVIDLEFNIPSISIITLHKIYLSFPLPVLSNVLHF